MDNEVKIVGQDLEIIEDFTLRSDRRIDEQIVPLYDLEAVAGLVELFIEGHIPLSEIKVPNMPPCDGAVHIKGNSMYPLINEGDIVLYKITQSRRSNLFFGEMYLLDFVIDGEEFVTVKYLHRSHIPGHYRLMSHNPEHEPRDIPIDSVRAMALVKTSIRFAAV